MEHDFRAVVPNFLKSNQVIIARWLAWRLARGELQSYIDPQTNTIIPFPGINTARLRRSITRIEI